MSAAAIRQALELRLAAMTPALPTAVENKKFTPVFGEPYQQVHLLWARPVNPSFGDGFRRLSGIMQVTLQYPIDGGTGDIDERADDIVAFFPRGLSVTASGVTTTIDRTPEVMSGRTEGDRYVIPVRVQFFANIE